MQPEDNPDNAQKIEWAKAMFRGNVKTLANMLNSSLEDGYDPSVVEIIDYYRDFIVSNIESIEILEKK